MRRLEHLLRRQRKRRDCTAGVIVFQHQLAAVLLHYGRADRQAEAKALIFGGVKRLEQVGLLLGADADAAVLHAHHDKS